MRKRIFCACLIFICFTFFACESFKGEQPKTESELILVQNEYYTIKKKNNEYIGMIYDVNGNIMKKEIFKKEPRVRLVSPEIVELNNGGGNETWTIFFDVAKLLTSPVYSNVSLIYINNEKMIVYMDFIDGALKLVIRDIFDKKNYYREIVRDFSEVAIPNDALINVKVITDNILRITYLVGDDYTEKEEDIALV